VSLTIGGIVAAVDYFLKIDGITGESLDAKHTGELELEGFTWGETQQGVPVASGADAGKVQFHAFHFAMRTSKASPQLLLACASGQHLKSAILTARKAGKTPQEFLVLTLTNVLVASYETGATPVQPYPTDQVSLSFGQIQVEYRAQKPNGTLEAPIQVGWNVAANRKV
jgi:type VI secretion system secreted protein Hcp